MYNQFHSEYLINYCYLLFKKKKKENDIKKNDWILFVISLLNKKNNVFFNEIYFGDESL